jgi:hypothetical protein
MSAAPEIVLKSLKVLRDDALTRRPMMDDLAIVYGWSMIRIGEQILGREMTAIDLYSMIRKD